MLDVTYVVVSKVGDLPSYPVLCFIVCILENGVCEMILDIYFHLVGDGMDGRLNITDLFSLIKAIIVFI